MGSKCLIYYRESVGKTSSSKIFQITELLHQYLKMKLGAHSKCSVIGKFVTLMVIGVVVPGSANPIWDFTKPTNNVAQAAVGGLALGAAGALALSYLKGSGGRSRSRGHYGGNYGWGRRKRDA